MNSVNVAFSLTQLTFPIFLAAGIAIPFITPTSTRIMIPLQVSLFAIALIDLWAAGIVGLIFLLREGGLLSFGVAITLFGTVFAVTYALALPLTVLQIEVAIYRQTHRT